MSATAAVQVRASVLSGQVAGSLIRTLISGILIVAVAMALGFRPTRPGTRPVQPLPCCP